MSATKHLKAYFTSFPQTEDQPGFNTHNHPTEAMFINLFASIPFFLNYGDKATTTEQGLAMAAIDANCYTFLSNNPANAGIGIAFTQPHQLPEMTLISSTAMTDEWSIEYGLGMKVTHPARTYGNGTRYNIRLAYDYVYFDLTEEGHLTFQGQLPSDPAQDTTYYYSYIDGTFSWIPINSGGSSLWSVVSDIVQTDGTQDVSIGTRKFYAGNIQLKEGANRLIELGNSTTGNGYRLLVKAGNGFQTADIGGDIALCGGYGQGGADHGNTLIGHNGSGHIGRTGIGGLPITEDININYLDYRCTVWNGIAYSGKLYNFVVGGGGPNPKITAPEFIMAFDSDGAAEPYTFTATRSKIFPTAIGAQLPIYDATEGITAWKSVSLSKHVTIDKDGAVTLANGIIKAEHLASDLLVPTSKIQSTIDVIADSVSTYAVTSANKVILVSVAAGGTSFNLPSCTPANKLAIRIIVDGQQGALANIYLQAVGSESICYLASDSNRITLSDLDQ